LTDTWEWDGRAWTLRSTSGPIGCVHAAMAYDAPRGVCRLVGGHTTIFYNGSLPVNHHWTWDGVAWTFVGTGPTARFRHAMAYDRRRQVIVMHGGTNQTSVFGDTWEWNGNYWGLRTISNIRCQGHSLAFDEDHSTIIMAMGGQAGPLYGDLWQWDARNDQWLACEAAPPAPGTRQGQVMAYDPIARESLLFGGHNSTEYNDTWRLNLSAPPAIATHPTNTLAAVNTSASLTVAPAGTGPFLYHWRRNGVPLEDGGNISGAHDDTLIIDPALFTDSASYDVQVSNACGEAFSDEATLSVVQPGDATGDHHVNVDDLLTVILGWGACPPLPLSCPADVAPLNGDGQVNVDDLIAVILNWGA
jgi:hypothetical protein